MNMSYDYFDFKSISVLGVLSSKYSDLFLCRYTTYTTFDIVQ